MFAFLASIYVTNFAFLSRSHMLFIYKSFSSSLVILGGHSPPISGVVMATVPVNYLFKCPNVDKSGHVFL